MTNFSYCSATQNDWELIRELASRVWYHTYEGVHTREQLEYMFERMYSFESLSRQMEEGHQFFIGCQNNVPIGYFSIEQKGTDLFYLQKLYVLPECQGTGAGKYLFLSVVEVIKLQHHTPCRLELNVNRKNKAIRFYEYMGMQITGESDDEIGNGFIMNNCFMAMEI